jgi:hypothetical protein
MIKPLPTLPPIVDASTYDMMCTQPTRLSECKLMEIAYKWHTAAKSTTRAVSAELVCAAKKTVLNEDANFEKHYVLTSSSELSGSMWHSPEAISTPEAAQVSVLAAACRRGVSLPLRTSSGSMPATAATMKSRDAAVILKIVIASIVAAPELIATGVSADRVCW